MTALVDLIVVSWLSRSVSPLIDLIVVLQERHEEETYQQNQERALRDLDQAMDGEEADDDGLLPPPPPSMDTSIVGLDQLPPPPQVLWLM